MMTKIKFGKVVVLILMLFIFAASVSPVNAYYIPAQAVPEARSLFAVTGQNDLGLYLLFEDHKEERWAWDGLRQMAMGYTNNGRVEDLEEMMRIRYFPNVTFLENNGETGFHIRVPLP